MLSLDVESPEAQGDVEIPDEWLAFAIQELRKNLEHALHLETELGGYGLRVRCFRSPSGICSLACKRRHNFQQIEDMGFREGRTDFSPRL